MPPTFENQYSLQEELNGCVFRHVKDFYEKYFEDKPWSAAANQVAQKVQPTVASSLSKDFLGIRSQESLSAWLARFETMFPSDEHIHYHFRNRQLSNSEDSLRANVYLVASDRAEPSSPSTAADARVFGEFNANTSTTGPKDVLRFCESARQVFQAQPTRRFLHGFQICGSMMELWVFDRSGAFSSEKLDTTQSPNSLIKTMVSYAMMNDEEVGFNSFIKQDGLGSYIEFGGVDGTEAERFYLEAEPIAAPLYIVGPSTTCYASRRLTFKSPNLAVKFAWREDKRHTELKLLTLTKERNAWGVIKVLGCQDLESIESLRQGLQFTQPYDFLQATADPNVVSEGNKCATSKSVNENYDQSFINRTFSCILTSPLGRSINKFKSILEFLEACRDVVKALRSLHQDGKILHRDICIKNLIIVSPHNEGYAKGALIDLDGSLDLAKGPARRGELVGSEGFMAIGILSGDPHTYRHDLESLLYVFFWVAICNDHDHDDQESLRDQPKTSRLWGWCSMDFRSVKRNKTIDMSPDGFPRILDEFSAEFKHLEGLAMELKELLFPLRDGEIFTGADMDQGGVNRLYDGMIDAFNRSIVSQAHKEAL
ncbi:MAG: hypothetical protein M1813_007185 [Trichoglossum hirsutum]|nr:MAG: hypothetical protein M1813_007185 [Trichoglossum hirsutum]